MLKRMPGFPALDRRRPVARVRRRVGAKRITTGRRGIATLVVLLLISVSMALSYAVMRSQTTALKIHQNATRQTELIQGARSAACRGLQEALDEMRLADWASDDRGINTILSRPIGNRLRYVATYAVGDPELQSGDDDYYLHPYRVTVVCTGYAGDPDRPTHEKSHRVQAVVQLVPQKLAGAASGWDEVLEHTISQYRYGSFDVDVPLRIAGDLRVRGEMEIGRELDWDGSERWWYLKGLKDLAEQGNPDYRPISGVVRWDGSAQLAETHGLITTALNGKVEYVSGSQEFYPPSTSSLARYRLYPGGKEYTAQIVSERLGRVTLSPDPVRNPLGIYVRYGRIELRDDVTVQGTLVTVGASSADTDVYGKNIRFEPSPDPIPQPPGIEDPIRLPALLSADDTHLFDGSEIRWEGVVYCGDDFHVFSSSQSGTNVELVGRIAAKDIYFEPRDEFQQSASWWNDRFNEFWSQHDQEDGISNWALYVEKLFGLRMKPRCVIEREPAGSLVYHHWPKRFESLFVPGDDDEGALRWKLLRWSDAPDEEAELETAEIEAMSVGTP